MTEAPDLPHAIDMHSHLLPEAWLREVKLKPSRFGVEVRSGDGSLTLAARHGPAAARPFTVFRPLWDVTGRLADLSKRKLSAQVVAPPTAALLYNLPRSNAQAVARLYNETIVDVAKSTNGALIPAATVPLGWPDLAVQELEYATKVLGIRIVFIGTRVGQLELDDDALTPFFRRLGDLGVPVQLHPAQECADTRLEKFFLKNLIGNPLDTGIAASRLISGGVLDRIDDLTVVLVHGGGVYPYLSGRMSHGYYAVGSARGSKRPHRGYFDRFFFDTLVHDSGALEFLVRSVGKERVVIGTDAPYSMSDSNPIESLSLVGLSQDEDVLRRNAARLLGLPLIGGVAPSTLP